MTVADFLAKEGEAPFHERIPLLGYGSNVCLAQLAYKFGMTPELNYTIVCFRASMKDSDIVYGSFLAPYGSLPAIIAPVKDAETEVWLTFLDRRQFEHMTSTEGLMELREHCGGKCVLKNGERFDKVYGYYYPHALAVDGELTRFQDIPGHSPLKAAWEANMLDWLKEMIGFEGYREHFIHLLRWDHSFHSKAEHALREYNLSFDHEDFTQTDDFKSLAQMKRSFVK
jgi:hypothetical protein